MEFISYRIDTKYITIHYNDNFLGKIIKINYKDYEDIENGLYNYLIEYFGIENDIALCECINDICKILYNC